MCLLTLERAVEGGEPLEEKPLSEIFWSKLLAETASCLWRSWLWIIDLEAELVRGNNSVSEKPRDWRCSEEKDEEKFGVRTEAEEMVAIGEKERESC